jgi:hypothetical protein
LFFKDGAGSSKSEACDVYLPHLIEEQYIVAFFLRYYDSPIINYSKKDIEIE